MLLHQGLVAAAHGRCSGCLWSLAWSWAAHSRPGSVLFPPWESRGSCIPGVCGQRRARSPDRAPRPWVWWPLLRSVAAPRQRSGWPHQPNGAPVLLIPNCVRSRNVDRLTPLGGFAFDERQPRAELIPRAIRSRLPFFNPCFYQGLICGRVAALVAWEPASLLAPRFLLWLHGGGGPAGDQ